MSEYPLPSYAASVWTLGDRLVLSFPSPLDAPAHVVQFPNTPKGMVLALETLREREREARSTTLGTKGAPSKYQVERALAEDNKYKEWLKEMGTSKEQRDADKAEAEAFLAELGL